MKICQSVHAHRPWLGLVLGLALHSGAQAEAPRLEEVLVTAEKRSASIQDVAMTVNAVSGEQLEKQAIFDFKQLQELTPGLLLQNNDPRAPVAILRGIAYNPDSAAAAAVDIYFNEVPLAPYVAFQTMFDVGQIEVLRGPQGTLRGRTSPGGAITIAARRPDLQSWEASFAASASTNDLANVQLAVGLPLVEDRLGLRLAMLSDSNGSEGGENVTTGRDQQTETRAARAVLEFRPIDSLGLVLTYQTLESEQDIFELVESEPGASREPMFDAYDRKAVAKLGGAVEVESRVATAAIDWELLGGHTLSVLGGYVGGDQTTRRDLDAGFAWPAADTPQLVAVDFPLHSYELRFASPQDQRWTYMIGAYYDRSEGDVFVSQASHAALTNDPNSEPLFSYDQEIVLPIEAWQKAVFARTRLDFLNVFSLEVGIRKARLEADTEAIFNARNHPAMIDQIPPLTDIALIPEDQQVQKASPTTGSATLSWQVDEDFLAYVNYGRSFRPGGVNLGAPNGIGLEYLLFDEEFSDSVELGIKSDWFDKRLRINAALFHQVFDGYIARSPFVPVDVDRNGQQDAGAAFTYNADAVSAGAEAELALAWSERWQSSLSLSYAKAVFDDAASPCDKRDANGNPEFTDENGNPGEQVPRCRNDGAVGNAPRFSAGLTTEYLRPLGGNEAFLRGLFKYNGERELADGSNLPGYSFVNLFVGLRNVEQTWEVSLWAKNLFDKEALTDRGNSELGVNSDGTPFGTPGNSARFDAGYRGVTPIREREIGVSFRYSL